MAPRISGWGKGCLSGSGEKNASWKPGSFHVQKDGQGKMLLPETLQQSRPVRSSDCAWRTNCCGIFCGPQEGGEGKGKIPHHIIVTAACIRCPSCGRFLQYPEAAATPLSIARAGRRRRLLLQNALHSSRNAASELTAIGECGCG